MRTPLIALLLAPALAAADAAIPIATDGKSSAAPVLTAREACLDMRDEWVRSIARALDAKDVARARVEIEIALGRERPDSTHPFDGYLLLGDFHYAREEYGRARDWYERAMEWPEARCFAYLDLQMGRIRLYQDQPSDAMMLFRQIVDEKWAQPAVKAAARLEIARLRKFMERRRAR